MESKGIETKEKNKKIIIAVILITAVLILSAVLCWWFFFRTAPDNLIGYESSAVTVTDEDTLQDIVDGMIKQTKDGHMALEYKNTAISSDGTNFSCYIANSAKNKYNMYVGIYLDSDLKDQIYLTKLIKPGDGIQNFQSSRKLTPGTYNAVLVFTQVKEDQQEIKSQVSVAYTLSVSEH